MMKWLLQVMLATVLGVMGLVIFTGQVKAADCNWNGSDGNWSTPGNWQNCGPGIPASGDTATINKDVSVTVDVPVSITAITINKGIINVSTGNNFTATTFNLTGGTLNMGDNSVSIPTFKWSDGTLTGIGGTTTVSSALEFSGTLLLTNHALVNNGAATWKAAGTLTGTTASFQNSGAGTLVKSNTGSVTMSGIDFANTSTGSVSVSGGTLALDLSGAVSSTGSYSVSNGAFLTFSGNHSFTGSSGISGAGTVTFSSGTVAVNGLYSVTGTTIMNGASTQVTLNQLPPSSTGPFNVNAGTLVFDDNNLRTFGSGANFNGAGTVEFKSGAITVSSNYALSAGGTTKISGADVNLSGISGTNLGGTLNLSAGSLQLGADNSVSTFTWSGGTLSGGSGTTTVTSTMGLSGNLALTNRGLVNTGAASYTGTGSLTGTGTPTFRNNGGGSFSKPDSGIVAMTGIAFTNTGSGTVSVNAGTLALALSSSVPSTKAYVVADGAFLTFSGTHTFNTGAGISGAGTVTFNSGTLVLNETYSVTGTTILNGATMQVTMFNLPASSTGAFTVNAGTLVFNDNHTRAFASGGFSGAGTIEFQSGTISVTSNYALSAGGTTKISGAGVDLSSGSVTSIGGTLVMSSGSLLLGADHSVGTFTWSGGTLSGAGQTQVNTTLSMSGSMSLSGRTLFLANSGTATLAGGGALSGSGTLNIAGTLTRSGSGTMDVTGITLTGAGMVQFSSATTNFSGTYSLSGTTTIDGGAVDLSSSSTSTSLGQIVNLSSTGSLNLGTNSMDIPTFNWGGGTLAGAGPTSVTNHMALSGSLTLTGRTLTNNGTTPATWSGNSSLSGTGTFVNPTTKQLTKSGTGTQSTLSTTGFSNTGTINVASGKLVLNLPASPDSTGTYISDTGAFLNFSGAHSFVAPSVISGPGTIEFQSGAVSITGGYAVSGTTIISGADLDLSNSALTIAGTLSLTLGSVDLGAKTASITALNLSGGQLSGTGSLTTQTMNWSNGTLSGTGTTTITSALAFSGSPALTNQLLINTGSASWTNAGTLTGTGTAIFRNSGAGTLSKSGAGAAAMNGIAFVNSSSGSVSVSEGTLTLDLSGAENSSGAYSAAAGAGLIFNGSHTFLDGINGLGNVTFNSGTYTLNGLFSIDGTTELNGAATQVTISQLPANIAGKFTINAGTVLFIDPNPRTFLAGANFNGAGIVEFRSGTYTLNSNLSLSAGGSAVFTSGAVMINGTYDVLGATTVSGAAVNLSGGAVTHLGGTLTISDGSLHLGPSDSVNTFHWSGGTLSGIGTTSVASTLTLSGTLVLDNRTLMNNGAANWTTSGSTTGTLTGTGTAVFLNNTGGTFNREGSNTTISISGPVFTNAGTVNVTGGTLDLGLSASISSSGPYTVASGAALRLAGSHTFASGGTIGGAGAVEFYSGAVTINNNYSLSGTTTISGAATTVTINYPASSSGTGVFVVASGTLVVNGSHTFNSGTGFSGAGTVQFNASNIIMNGGYTLSGPTFINGAGTTVELNFPSSSSVSGSFTVNNPAKLTFGVASGSLSFGSGANLNGTGAVEFKSGSVLVSSNYTISGTTIVSGAFLDLSGSTLAITGSTLDLSLGTINLGAKTASIAALTLTGGEITGSNELTTQALNWSGGTMTGSGTTRILTSLVPNLIFNGSLVLTDRTLINNGLASWGAAGGLSGTGTFSNLNLLTKSGTGTQTTLSTAGFNNAGTVNVASGTLQIDLPALPNSTGTFSTANGAFLILSGAHSFAVSSMINGSGTVEFPTGSVSISGGYAVTGTTIINGSALDLANSALAITGAAIQLSSGSVNLGAKTASIDSLTLSGGDLTGTNTLNVATLNWNGGTMSGGGTTSVTSQWNIVGDPIFTNRTINNGGIANWASDGTISGTGTLVNTGFLIKTGVGTVSTISGITFVNSGGSVNVNNGTLAIGMPVAFPSNGIFNVVNGANLNFSGAHTFGSGATISGGGAIQFQTGSVSFNGVYNLDSLTGNTRISAADVNMAGATITSLGANLDITGGSLNLGPSTVSLAAMNWSAGTLSGSGLLSVNTSLSLSGTLALSGLTLDNNGVATCTSSSAITGSGILNNAGTLAKTGTGTTSLIGVAVFGNSGSITANQGTLDINLATAASSSGSYTSNGSAAIIFSGVHTFTPTASISGNGTIEFKSGTVNFPGGFTASGNTLFSGATVNFITPAVVTNLGADVFLSAGVLNLTTGIFPAGSPLSVSSLSLTGGTLTGADSLSISTLNWSSGVMSGSGTTVIPTGGNLNFTGSDSLILDTRNLVNNGTVTWNRINGSSYLYFSNDAQFTNDLSGTFSLQNSGLYVFLGLGTFQNMGSFVKTNLDPVEMIGVSFINSGSVAVNKGSLQIFFSPSTTSTGTYTVDTGAALSFTGSHTFAPVSGVGGDGDLSFTSGAMAVNGKYEVNGSTTVSGAAVNLTDATVPHLGAVLNISAGSLNLGAHQLSIPTLNLTGGEILGTDLLTVGTLNWSDGHMKGLGTTLVDTKVNFNGTTPLILDQRSLVNHGTAEWNNSGYLYLTNDAVILNDAGATMNLKSSISYVIYGTGTLNNHGILNFSLGKIDVTTFRQSAGAELNLTIKGLVTGDDFGQVSTHAAELDGTLNIEFSGYTPAVGKRFALIKYSTSPTAQFATTQITDHLPPNAMDWKLTYEASSLDLWTESIVVEYKIFMPFMLK